MANNTKFDRDEVIDKALQLYWNRGFHGTSMRILQDEIDMRPGSIYAAFGSKEGLFKQALIRYTQLGSEHLRQCRSKVSSPLAALKLFMLTRVTQNQMSSPSCMCLLAKTIAELTDANAELLEQARSSLKAMESSFESLIIEAQSLNELSNRFDSKELARHVQINFSGLRTYIRVHGMQVPTEEIIDGIFSPFISRKSLH
ncbi:TetR/AcrR family transcriptional regulator [Aliiglaciecola sp. 3_MG-2023]|uniref:TetR/AcrR family transcriptional regulator n=1 Tax=Aliiglaciecola sp. 3_MG-2023 TaxID=3062644 RepID=UPI0026E35A3D|nr:TetR/AcrR family transcriptional regulator [Aliiglaciecola sp. 3_MG-2023]MDO6693922.1 TetR/AcrR family transcriptional regulator [Aliiglaciecola sp. 3_MG-2023]